MTFQGSPLTFKRNPKVEFFKLTDNATILDFRSYIGNESQCIADGYLAWEDQQYRLSDRFSSFILTNNVTWGNHGLNTPRWLPLCIRDFVLSDQKLMLFKLQFG